MSTPGLFTGHFSLTLQSAKRYSAQAVASQVKTLNCHAFLLHLTHGRRLQQPAWTRRAPSWKDETRGLSPGRLRLQRGATRDG